MCELNFEERDYHRKVDISITILKLSHIIRKPVLAICKQQRHSSACTSTNLISTIVVCCLDSIIPILAKSQQVGSSLTWSQPPNAPVNNFLTQNHCKECQTYQSCQCVDHLHMPVPYLGPHEPCPPGFWRGCRGSGNHWMIHRRDGVRFHGG